MGKWGFYFSIPKIIFYLVQGTLNHVEFGVFGLGLRARGLGFRVEGPRRNMRIWRG